MMGKGRPDKRVLVVEDNAFIREGVARVLASGGFAVATAANGREALNQLRARPRPHLILLDLAMPVMDGWQFRREQEQDRALAGIPVVLFSGEEDVGRHASALGVAGYLPKPWSPSGSSTPFAGTAPDLSPPRPGSLPGGSEGHRLLRGKGLDDLPEPGDRRRR